MQTISAVLMAAHCAPGHAGCQDSGLPWVVIAAAAVLVIALVLWLNRAAKR